MNSRGSRRNGKASCASGREGGVGIPFVFPGDIAGAFSNPQPELDFCLPGFLAGSVGAFVAMGAAGKTFGALSIAILLTSGADLLGLGQFPLGQVLYLALDDPWDALAARFHALGSHLSPDQKELVAQRLDIRPLFGTGFDIGTRRWLEFTLEAAISVRLIIIDTLRRTHVLDENCAADMARLVQRLELIAQKSGGSVLFLHHTNKSSYSGGGDEQGATRGSSVLVDNIRWQCFLAPMNEVELKTYRISPRDRGHYVRWGISKQNYGAPIAPIWLHRTEGGVLRPAQLQSRVSTPSRTGGRREI